MTVRELHERLNHMIINASEMGDLQVYMASDPEGNSFNRLVDLDFHLYKDGEIETSKISDGEEVIILWA